MNKAFIQWWCKESGWCKDGNWQDDEGTSEFTLAQEAWQRGAQGVRLAWLMLREKKEKEVRA